MFEKINIMGRKIREVILKPFLTVLVKAGISANLISTAKIVLMAPFFYLVDKNLFWAGAMLIIALMLDGLDGPLARLAREQSDRGKFFDLLSDHIIYSVEILAVIYLGLVDGLTGAYQIFIIAVIYLLAIIKKNEQLKSDWLISPSPRIIYYKVFFNVIFALYLFWQINFLQPALFYLNIIMTLAGVYYYFIIVLRKWKKSDR
ncbi:MAG TPA: CDP-alcohol phosphatidyltransferase family protein [Patescibacteria group bacterium]